MQGVVAMRVTARGVGGALLAKQFKGMSRATKLNFQYATPRLVLEFRAIFVL